MEKISGVEETKSLIRDSSKHSSSSITSLNKSEKVNLSSSQIIYFGCQSHSGIELWDTTYFLSILFELLDEYKDNSKEESRLTAFILCRFDDMNFNTRIPIKLVLQILKYFTNIRMKILLLLEFLNLSETIDCSQALMLLWQFSTYGYMTLFYVLDRLKFSIIDKDREWKSLLTIFEPLENKKHAAYIVLDKTNFYKPNQATIVFGSKKLQRYF
ncbi:hypothetical protein I4U23_028026 [Adineta vaga]|nr:hypothetical protein I4U23_028026 [Adineta vaga]